MSIDVESPYPSNIEIRRWGQAKGLPVPDRGQLHLGLIKAWDRAHPDRPYVKAQAFHGTVGGYANHGCRCAPCTAVCRDVWRDKSVADWEDDL